MLHLPVEHLVNHDTRETEEGLLSLGHFGESPTSV